MISKAKTYSVKRVTPNALSFQLGSFTLAYAGAQDGLNDHASYGQQTQASHTHTQQIEGALLTEGMSRSMMTKRKRTITAPA